MPKLKEKSLLAESNLPVGQRDILKLMQDRGLALRADKFAYLAFGRDIEELDAEELQEIPDELLEPWLEENDLRQEIQNKSDAHTDWMNECVPELMGYGKDQLTAVAACLNMWRNAWEESHPDGADDPGPSPKEADPDSPLAEAAKKKMLAYVRALPRTLYVHRKLLNRDELIAWAKAQGFATTLDDEMHVTVAFSKQPFEWDKVSPDGEPVIVVGGKRGVEELGDEGAIVLRFESRQLQADWQRYRDAGASWDYPGYKPHVTITYDGGDVDLSKVKPYRGELRFGPEVMEEIDKDLEIKERLFNESDHPRDEHGRWTDGSGGDDVAPETADGLPPDDELLFVSEFPNQAKLDKWNDVLNARSEELATQGLAGNDEDDHIARMSSALAKFSQEDDILLQSGDSGLNAVYDSNMKLQAAAFAYVKGRVAIISSFGALKHDAGVKALKQAALKYSNKTDQIEGKFWSDDTTSRAAYEEAGFKQLGENEGGMITMVKTDLPGGGITKNTRELTRRAEATAKKLDFDPTQIVYTNESRDFTLAGQKYKYAGSYQFGSPQIKLYMGQLNSENIKGVTAHEIGHRKFDLLTKLHKIQFDAMMQDPGPPPDPDHQYWWGKKGGHDAIMNPTGEMRPPYDQKYPLCDEWAKIQNMRPSLEQDDGITDYSKTYWKEWEKGAVNTNTAYHETMAEISRAQATMGKHSAVTGSGWRRLYRLQEKVWAANANLHNVSTLPETPTTKSLERVVIDHRNATIVYMDDNFTPVDQDKATLVKITFDDGEIIFVTPDAGEAEAKMAVANLEEMRALLRAKRIKSQFASAKRRSLKLLDKYFDESKHPRDQGGKFSETGGESVDGESGGNSKRKEGETDKEFAKRVVDKRPAPKDLPEKHDDYFNMDGATVMPLDKLVSGKTAEENKQGGENGAKRMAAAAKGELSKRDPITVQPIAGSDKYEITDGNGTFTTVQKYGWKAIPVKIEGGAGADLTNQASVNYKPHPPGLKAESGTVNKVRQDWVNESPIQTIDDVKRAAPQAQDTLGKVGNAIAAKLGVEYMHPTAKTQKLDDAGAVVENPKGVARILEKIAKKEAETGKPVPMARITDATRGTFVLNRESDARKVVDELSKSYEMIDEGWRTIPDTHYTDRPLLFRDPKTGLIGEIQLSHPALLKAKDSGGGHELYEEARVLPDGNARKDELNAQMQKLYGGVLNSLPPEWKKIDGRRGYKDRH